MAYTYIGEMPLGYVSYVDTATDKMLIASPGRSYGIRAVVEGDPVPPADGRWQTAPDPGPGQPNSGDQIQDQAEEAEEPAGESPAQATKGGRARTSKAGA